LPDVHLQFGRSGCPEHPFEFLTQHDEVVDLSDGERAPLLNERAGWIAQSE